ncbi:MAG TPA: hypothetical protein EYP55_10385 [Anaerolineae bacterium]|nr:hypothetical protein [Anaerolineae bacterium]
MPGLNGTGPAGMGPMTGGGRGWCNPYSPLYAGYMPYPVPYPYVYRPTYAPMAGWPAWGFRPYWGYPWGLGRPRWGLRGFWGRGIGWGGRGRGRWW